jgi:hypothetical protein
MNREKEFSTIINKISSEENILLGKINFRSNDEVFISVDNVIEFEDEVFLIEIDSSNQAKLVAGQYALLCFLFKNPIKKNDYFKSIIFDNKKKITFFVVHCYKNYNRERSLNNLIFLKQNLKSMIGVGTIHMDDLKRNLKNVNSKVDLLNSLKSNCYKQPNEQRVKI